jgi:hypothetical protein
MQQNATRCGSLPGNERSWQIFWQVPALRTPRSHPLASIPRRPDGEMTCSRSTFCVRFACRQIRGAPRRRFRTAQPLVLGRMKRPCTRFLDFSLTINPPLTLPVITSQPQSQSVLAGESVTFTVGGRDCRLRFGWPCSAAACKMPWQLVARDMRRARG